MEGGQALGLDLQKVSRQDSSRNTHALEHGPSQKRVSFLLQVDREQVKLCVPTLLLGRISNEDPTFLSASPNAGARTIKGSSVQSEANDGVRCMGGITQKRIETLSSEADMRRIVFIGNN